MHVLVQFLYQYDSVVSIVYTVPFAPFSPTKNALGGGGTPLWRSAAVGSTCIR
jgi:hypothetical protein